MGLKPWSWLFNMRSSQHRAQLPLACWKRSCQPLNHHVEHHFVIPSCWWTSFWMYLNCCYAISFGRCGFTRARWHRIFGLLYFFFFFFEFLKTLGGVMACLSLNLLRFLRRLLDLALLIISFWVSFCILAPFALSFGTLLGFGLTFPFIKFPIIFILWFVYFAFFIFLLVWIIFTSMGMISL